jgi:carotenoid cleavage dioxygenase-like enzyme
MTMPVTIPMAREDDRGAQAAPRCLVLLGVSERGGRNEAAEIEGKIPRELRGSLYRNGPGLFDRSGLRKPHLLDGDGLVQRLSFADGTAHYQNAFVRTPKFVGEEAAGRFLFATWSMRRPGGLIANLGGASLHSQAGVTVYPFKDLLYAFDEVSPAFGLDPETLETLGEQTFGRSGQGILYQGPYQIRSAHRRMAAVWGDPRGFDETARDHAQRRRHAQSAPRHRGSPAGLYP